MTRLERTVRSGRRWIARYTGGKLGEPTPWFVCNEALCWDPGEAARGRTMVVVTTRPTS